MKILVTGGAGFVGRHVIARLIKSGHELNVLDNLDPQVHGNFQNGALPKFPNGVGFLHGDVTEPGVLSQALSGCDSVVHLAATVGVGQSMYQPVYYTHANVTGTARLFEVIIKEKKPIKKIVVASSMSAYGEGMYQCGSCSKITRGSRRNPEDLERLVWELRCPQCAREMRPIGIPEVEPFDCQSVYALTKRDTEELALMLGRAYNIKTNALRFFNVYGPGQSLSNPYTGVLAIFFSRVLNGNPPCVYEDGNQSRDFIYVTDVARAIELTLASDQSGEVFNVGRGIGISIHEIARHVIRAAKLKLKPQITQQFRPGDVRHCFADASKMKKLLGFSAQTELKEGLAKLYEWTKSVKANDYFDKASSELTRFGLLRKPLKKLRPKWTRL